MPVNLSIKNVPEELAEKLRRRAATNNRSLQRELMVILQQATQRGGVAAPSPAIERPHRSVQELFDRMRQRIPHPTLNSVDIIRETRDERERNAGRSK